MSVAFIAAPLSAALKGVAGGALNAVAEGGMPADLGKLDTRNVVPPGTRHAAHYGLEVG